MNIRSQTNAFGSLALEKRANSGARSYFACLVLSLREAIGEQFSLMVLRWLRRVSVIPVLMRLRQVGWWLARNDACGQGIVRGSYEKRERQFVEDLLRPGMTVLDIGAHHGLYTLLASRRVGPQGQVVAFEPSARERNNLLQHLRLNRCRNVHVEAVALGSKCGTGELFVVQGIETGCNSLRPPDVSEPTVKASVSVETLDGCVKRLGIAEVDFVKIDAEGAELEVFKGGTELLKRAPRPIMLVEVQDLRTAAWGYRAKEIVEFLRRYEYCWFRLTECGLQLFEDDRARIDENLVAIPRERGLPDIGSQVNIGLEAQSC